MFREHFLNAVSQLGQNTDYGECHFRIILHVLDKAV